MFFLDGLELRVRLSRAQVEGFLHLFVAAGRLRP